MKCTFCILYIIFFVQCPSEKVGQENERHLFKKSIMKTNLVHENMKSHFVIIQKIFTVVNKWNTMHTNKWCTRQIIEEFSVSAYERCFLVS